MRNWERLAVDEFMHESGSRASMWITSFFNFLYRSSTIISETTLFIDRYKTQWYCLLGIELTAFQPRKQSVL